MSAASKPTSLRDHLTKYLSSISCPHELHLTVLSSTPKRTTAIFPHARHPPKCFEKQYVVTLGISIPADPPFDTQTSATSAPALASTSSPNPDGSTSAEPTQSAKTEPTSVSPAQKQEKVVLVAAIHAYLYTIPTLSRSILYISKVDSSGYLPSRISLTRSLVVGFISYHLLPKVRQGNEVCVQLFARSQGQYLFPNSVQAAGKKVTGGLRLCGWWKGVYEEVARQVDQRARRGESNQTNGSTSNAMEEVLPVEVSLRYLLPSYSAEEAAGMLGAPRQALPDGIQWRYGPPFSTNRGKASNGSGASSKAENLATMIPSLPDDPKTRFLEELVSEAPPYIPPTKSTNGKTTAHESIEPSQTIGNGTKSHASSSGQSASSPSDRTLAPQSSTISVQTDTTATETLPDGQAQSSSPKKRKSAHLSASREKEKERDDVERAAAEGALSHISPEEFWERMGFRQECSSGDVTGFFTLEVHPSAAPLAGNGNSNDSTKSNALEGETKEPALPNVLIDRLLTALLNTDFATLTLATEGTEIWTRSARGIVVSEIGERGWEGCISVIAVKEGVETPKVEVKRKEEVVTMLQPRKKKKV